MATTMYMSGVSLIVQYLSNLGLMAAGGQLNTYVGGSANTPVTTYTDSTGIVPNANPMTLSSTGRPVAANGAPVAFWAPAGTTIKLVVYDAGGNLLVQLDNIPSLNDLANSNNALQVLLASAASSNSSGVGPVAGADLVANAVKSYDVFADVRSANQPVLATGQTLNIEVQGALNVGDSLGGHFYWSSTSTAADDGRTVLKPNSVGAAAPGRWLRYLALGEAFTVTLAADQALTTNTSLTNTALTALLSTAAVYELRMRLQFIGTGGTGQGWKASAAFSGSINSGGDGTGVVTGAGTPAMAFVAIGGTVTSAAIGTGSTDVCNVDFIFQTGSAGTLTVQFAQNSSSANATTIKAGSSIILTRIA